MNEPGRRGPVGAPAPQPPAGTSASSAPAGTSTPPATPRPTAPPANAGDGAAPTGTVGQPGIGTVRSVRPQRKALRRTQVVVRRVGPWSVFKFSLLFSFCAMLIVYFAMLIIYLILSAAGAIDSLAKILGYVFGTGTSTLGPTPVKIDGKQLFTWLFIAGCVFAFVWSVINVFIAFLYNLISDIVGGVEVTLAEKPHH